MHSNLCNGYENLQLFNHLHSQENVYNSRQGHNKFYLSIFKTVKILEKTQTKLANLGFCESCGVNSNGECWDMALMPVLRGN